MMRSNSDRKWKQVLGFDDGSFSGPPEYSDMPEVVSEPVLATIPSYPRLPKDITFYRKKHDIVLAPSPPAPSPNDLKPLPSPPHLFYISVQEDPFPFNFTRHPSILLHTGPSKSSPILSYVEFQNASMKADMTICPSGSAYTSAYRSLSSFRSDQSISSDSLNSDVSKPRTERLSPTGGIFSAEKFCFSYTLPRNFVRERFEWRYSSGPFIRTAEGAKESGGLKLVRVSTNETVAVYAGFGGSARPPTSKRVLGMFRFLSGPGLAHLGEEFEVLAVMSILAVVERSKRSLMVQKAAFGIR